MREHVEEITRLTRMPTAVADDADLPTRFLGLACLTYGGDDRSRFAQARELLVAHPEVGTSSIHAMAAAGEVDAARALLREQPALVTKREGRTDGCRCSTRPTPASTPRVTVGQPSRSPDCSSKRAPIPTPATCGTAPTRSQRSLARSAAARTGRTSPSTTTACALARLLLEAGADPNDTQALYNRMFRPGTEHLELLFEFGLGEAKSGGTWEGRQGPGAMTIQNSLGMDLQWAAEHDFPEKVRLLLDHGVDPDFDCGHPTFGGSPPLRWRTATGTTPSSRPFSPPARRNRHSTRHRVLSPRASGGTGRRRRRSSRRTGRHGRR